MLQLQVWLCFHVTDSILQFLFVDVNLSPQARGGNSKEKAKCDMNILATWEDSGMPTLQTLGAHCFFEKHCYEEFTVADPLVSSSLHSKTAGQTICKQLPSRLPHVAAITNAVSQQIWAMAFAFICPCESAWRSGRDMDCQIEGALDQASAQALLLARRWNKENVDCQVLIKYCSPKK